MEQTYRSFRIKYTMMCLAYRAGAASVFGVEQVCAKVGEVAMVAAVMAVAGGGGDRSGGHGVAMPQRRRGKRGSHVIVFAPPSLR